MSLFAKKKVNDIRNGDTPGQHNSFTQLKSPSLTSPIIRNFSKSFTPKNQMDNLNTQNKTQFLHPSSILSKKNSVYNPYSRERQINDHIYTQPSATPFIQSTLKSKNATMNTTPYPYPVTTPKYTPYRTPMPSSFRQRSADTTGKSALKVRDILFRPSIKASSSEKKEIKKKRLSGKWERKEFDEKLKIRTTKGYTDESKSKLYFNIILLIAFLFLWRQKYLENIYNNLSAIDYGQTTYKIIIGVVVFFIIYNIIECLCKAINNKKVLLKSEKKIEEMKKKKYENDVTTNQTENVNEINDMVSKNQASSTSRTSTFISLQPIKNKQIKSSSPTKSSKIKFAVTETPIRGHNVSFLMNEEPIRDSKGIDNLFKEINNQEIYNKNAVVSSPNQKASYFTQKNNYSLMTSRMQIPISSYQSALPSVTPGMDRVIPEIVGGLPYKHPQWVINELQVEPYLDYWTENLRKWLSQKILTPIVKQIERVDKILSENNMEFLNCTNASLIDNAAALNAALSANNNNQTTNDNKIGTGMFGTTGMSSFSNTGFMNNRMNQIKAQPKSLIDLIQLYKDQQITQERIKLEKCLIIGDYHCREYIIDRIKTLARGGCLAAYRWDSGGDWKGKAWNQERYPTDAEIILHLFCSYMDLQMPGRNSSRNSSFTDEYYVPKDGKHSPYFEHIQIKQVEKYPPRYSFIARGCIWGVYPKRNNLFQTICLFLYFFKLEHSGYLNLFNLDTKGIELLSQVLVPCVQHNPLQSSKNEKHGNTERNSKYYGYDSENMIKYSSLNSSPKKNINSINSNATTSANSILKKNDTLNTNLYSTNLSSNDMTPSFTLNSSSNSLNSNLLNKGDKKSKLNTNGITSSGSSNYNGLNSIDSINANNTMNPLSSLLNTPKKEVPNSGYGLMNSMKSEYNSTPQPSLKRRMY